MEYLKMTLCNYKHIVLMQIKYFKMNHHRGCCNNADLLASTISRSCWQSLFFRVVISCWKSLTRCGSIPRVLAWAARSFSTSAFNSEQRAKVL